MKRLFDLLVSTALLGMLAPLLLAVAVLVRVIMGWPVLFAQERPGLQGRSFRIYKFRTMSMDRDLAGDPLHDAQRLTPLGMLLRRLSLDELPQLFNVLKGDMSLVGPRPLLMEYLPLYSAEQMRRHAVRPGITGWTQVNGRNALSWEEKFALDVWYVDHQSFWLDLKILVMTVKRVFSGSGVTKEGHATTEKFRGSAGG
jgi:sugar transferase EpsL